MKEKPSETIDRWARESIENKRSQQRIMFVAQDTMNESIFDAIIDYLDAVLPSKEQEELPVTPNRK